MWEVVKHDCSTGKWVSLGKYDSVDSAKEGANNINEDKKHIFYFWTAEMPSEQGKALNIIKAMFQANDGRMKSIILGADISIKKSPKATEACTGDCYCVVTEHGNSRECQTFYRAPGGGIWVSCGTTC